MTVLVGGVGELFQGDLDLGRLAAESLKNDGLGPDVMVEELYYGAVAVTQRIEELRPEALVLVGAVRRGRTPGSVERRMVTPQSLSRDELQAAVGDAVTGYVGIDLIIEVATGLSFLPRHTITVEVEPEYVGPVEGLTPCAARGLAEALELVRMEVRRLPLFQLAAHLRPLVASDRLHPAPALVVIRDLLGQLELLEREGSWGRAAALRDQLRLEIATCQTDAGMDGEDWALWEALVEGVDRVQSAEASTPPVA
ncbi:MAG: hypothetical protein H0T14_06655 [Nocardioidaceae bacterium]|nr:hypothetical protein [Nocardioidaceae bacterium]